MASMFSSLFSRDPSQSFGYDVGEKIVDDPERYLWTLNHANKKGVLNEKYLVLSLDAKFCTEHQLNLGKASMKRLKTLKHPSVLNYVDSLESEKLLHVVTEPAIPLELHLNSKPYQSNTMKEMAISWGIFQITSALKFLNQEANLSHNNIHSGSIFVTTSGEWKLAGLEYMCSTDSDPPRKPYDLEKYDPPERKGERRAKEPWSSDIWGVACLIWESFNGTLPNMQALKTVKNIPNSWNHMYLMLINANPRRRPSPEDLLRECRKSGGLLKNKFVDTLLFLEEFQLREAREKAAFFNHLKDDLDLFPKDVAKNKILPRLIEAYQYGDAGSSVLTPLFKIGITLNDEEYQAKIVPCIVQLFASTDRTTRVKLLEKMEHFGPHLNANIVNEKIFTNLIGGFMDTNPAVREATVKAMVYLAPKLNKHNLDIELMKHLARLQSKDDQPGIRTNTTICLGKIGIYLDAKDRQKIMISAFTRSLKDPFPPARVSGVLALSATQQFYQVVEIANRILPALCPLTFDPEKSVRDEAFKALRGFLDKLDKASENPDLIPQMEEGVMAKAGQGELAPDKVPAWASWALGAISGKFYKSPATPVKPEGDCSGPKSGSPNLIRGSEARNLQRKSPPRQERVPEITDQFDNNEDENAWAEDEEWGDIDDIAPEPVKNLCTKPKANNNQWASGKEDSDWANSWGQPKSDKKSSESKGSSGMKLSCGVTKSHNEESEFLREFDDQASSFSTNSSFKPQQANNNRMQSALSASTAFGPSGPIRTTLGKKKQQENEEIGGGWGGFGDEPKEGWDENEWEPIEEIKDDKKKVLAEKQAQKKLELEAKRKARALKLGAKKM